MNVIFLTLFRIKDIEARGIYEDLMRKFRNEGHQVYIVCPVERREGLKTSLVEQNGVKILNVKTLNIQKTNVVEKGLGTLLIESQYIKAIKKYLSNVSFDLITYSTPPITFTNAVKYLKKQNPNAVSYLQLKDIFPQNAVDIGMLNESFLDEPSGKAEREFRGYRLKSVVKYLLYKFFRKKEVALYKNSDYIGCMSPANVEYLKKHNPYYPADHVEVAPNSIDLLCKQSEQARANLDPDQRRLKVQNEWYYIRKKYDLPMDIPIFIYGGNLGKPQGIDYLIKCLDACKKRLDCFFVVVGNGTEYGKLEAWYNQVKVRGERFLDEPSGIAEREVRELSVKLMQRLPKEDYDMLVKYCDVGLIFLDHRFTIPNYPSRLLSYLENKMPVICATDVNTDIGKIAEENGYGYWCESVKPEDFTALVDKMLKADRKAMGEKGYEFLKKNYLVEHTYNAIMKHLKP